MKQLEEMTFDELADVLTLEDIMSDERFDAQVGQVLRERYEAATKEKTQRLDIKGVSKISVTTDQRLEDVGGVDPGAPAPVPDARIVRVGEWTKFEEMSIEQIVSAIFQAGHDSNADFADALQKELERRIAGDDAVFTPPNPVKVVLCTEDGADAYDWSAGKTVKKYLVIDGMTLYHPEGTAVTLDTDSPGTMVSELAGMVYDIEATERDDMPGQPELEGIMKFSGGSAGEKGWGYYKKDPFNRFSVGYREDESVHVPEGKTYTIPERTFVDRASVGSKFDGRTFVGPCIVVTRWTLLQILLLPTA